MKSRMAWSYARCELGDVRLLRTADRDCSRSGSRRTVFGLRLRFGFGMSAFSTEHASADPETKSAFIGLYLPQSRTNLVIGSGVSEGRLGMRSTIFMRHRIYASLTVGKSTLTVRMPEWTASFRAS